MEEALFICPDCGESSSGEEWNDRTSASYGGVNITEIDSLDPSDCLFVCPVCDVESDYEGIEKREFIPTENEEALGLLKKEW